MIHFCALDVIYQEFTVQTFHLTVVLNRIINLPDTRYPAGYPVDPDIRYSPIEFTLNSILNNNTVADLEFTLNLVLPNISILKCKFGKLYFFFIPL